MPQGFKKVKEFARRNTAKTKKLVNDIKLCTATLTAISTGKWHSKAFSHGLKYSARGEFQVI